MKIKVPGHRKNEVSKKSVPTISDNNITSKTISC